MHCAYLNFFISLMPRVKLKLKELPRPFSAKINLLFGNHVFKPHPSFANPTHPSLHICYRENKLWQKEFFLPESWRGGRAAPFPPPRLKTFHWAESHQAKYINNKHINI